jgi:hypothetical protein
MHVRLASSDVRYNGALLQAEVTVQNLLDQPMGTDGTTVSGTRVFFHSGPTVVEGTGSVSVQADSVGTFTAADQPFYLYAGVIQPAAVSSPRTWTFAVDPVVVRFEFMVFVETTLPGEGSILHWRTEQAPLPFEGPYTDISAAPNAAFVSGVGKVIYFDGNAWTDLGDPGCNCRSVAAVSHDEAFVVGAAGAVRHWTGSEWVDVSSDVLSGVQLKDVWGASPRDVWAISDSTMYHFDGTEWTAFGATLPLGGRVMAIWGSGPDDVWVVGLAGMILHWNGQVWFVQSLARFGTDLLAVWGSGPNDVWAGGFVDCPCGGALFHYDGTTWTQVSGVPGLEQTFPTAGASSPGEVWAITYHGALLHDDGGGWSNTEILPGVLARKIASPAPGTAIALATEGDQDLILRNDGDGWKLAVPPPEPLTGVWGSSASDVWAVGGGSIRHRLAGTWTWEPTPGGIPLADVWGASATDVWAVGDSGIAHFDGEAWTRSAGAAIPLRSVWGSSPTDVWAGGDDQVAHWDGSSWTTMSLPIGHVADVWGSSAANVFAVGEDGQIRRWDGSAWTTMASGTAVALSGVWGSGPGDVYAVGIAGTVLHYDGNAAGSWTTVATPASEFASIEAVWGSGPGDVYILADAGASVVHWDGASWRKLTTFPFVGARMLALWGSGPHDIYAAGNDGRVVHGTR